MFGCLMKNIKENQIQLKFYIYLNYLIFILMN